jgi:hypothetical protein
VTPDLQHDGSADDDGLGEHGFTPADRALLEAALEFYGAAEGVIDYVGQERPQLRQDAAGFAAVRAAMAALEDRVREAHAAGASPQRIAEIARIEREMVELILQRSDAAAPDPSEG